MPIRVTGFGNPTRNSKSVLKNKLRNYVSPTLTMNPSQKQKEASTEDSERRRWEPAFLWWAISRPLKLWKAISFLRRRFWNLLLNLSCFHGISMWSSSIIRSSWLLSRIPNRRSYPRSRRRRSGFQNDDGLQAALSRCPSCERSSEEWRVSPVDFVSHSKTVSNLTVTSPLKFSFLYPGFE